MNAGLEGDRTFYLGDNAELMRGHQDIDLDVQPAPDLAIEVEVEPRGGRGSARLGAAGRVRSMAIRRSNSDMHILEPPR